MLQLNSKKVTKQATLSSPRKSCTGLFLRMALQNTQRRPSRTLMLIIAVALGSAAVFSSYVVARGIASSTEQSFERMGADLIVVPSNAMVNITSALLTVQPTEAAIDRKTLEEIARIDGVDKVAPQTIYRMSVMAGMPEHRVNMIGFDPAHDFTVMPWLNAHLSRPFQTGDIIAGGRRAEQIDQEIQPANLPSMIYGKLGLSGVGPFDDSLFASYDTLERLGRAPEAASYISGEIDPGRVSAGRIRRRFEGRHPKLCALLLLG